MKSTTLKAVFMLAMASACAGVPQENRPTDDQPAKFTSVDVGRNAAIVLAADLRVQELVQKGQREEALRTLDSAHLYQISLLRQFDQELSTDERHVRLRNRVVERLKRLWLEHPPEYLDDASASFIENKCLAIPGCPPGKIQGRKPLPGRLE